MKQSQPVVNTSMMTLALNDKPKKLFSVSCPFFSGAKDIGTVRLSISFIRLNAVQAINSQQRDKHMTNTGIHDDWDLGREQRN